MPARDLSITLPVDVVSRSPGGATDDGLPGASLTYQWSKVSGPGFVFVRERVGGLDVGELRR